MPSCSWTAVSEQQLWAAFLDGGFVQRFWVAQRFQRCDQATPSGGL